MKVRECITSSYCVNEWENFAADKKLLFCFNPSVYKCSQSEESTTGMVARFRFIAQKDRSVFANSILLLLQDHFISWRSAFI